MSKLLYIIASPRGDRSYSKAVGDAFVEAYREANPNDEIAMLNLFEIDLPSFDGPALEVKYAIMSGKEATDEQREAWKAIEAVIEEFKSADKYVIATPMWNFGVPYRLKRYIDVIVQPSYLFSYSPDQGYKGLVTGKPAFVAYARGGAYGEGTGSESMDFQKTYLEALLGFIGFTDVQSAVVEPTALEGPDVAAKKRDAAIAKAREIAKSF
jgi:FMN-dependent NADH-azoreductase